MYSPTMGKKNEQISEHKAATKTIELHEKISETMSFDTLDPHKVSKIKKIFINF